MSLSQAGIITCVFILLLHLSLCVCVIIRIFRDVATNKSGTLNMQAFVSAYQIIFTRSSEIVTGPGECCRLSFSPLLGCQKDLMWKQGGICAVTRRLPSSASSSYSFLVPSYPSTQHDPISWSSTTNHLPTYSWLSNHTFSPLFLSPSISICLFLFVVTGAKAESMRRRVQTPTEAVTALRCSTLLSPLFCTVCIPVCGSLCICVYLCWCVCVCVWGCVFVLCLSLSIAVVLSHTCVYCHHVCYAMLCYAMLCYAMRLKVWHRP